MAIKLELSCETTLDEVNDELNMLFRIANLPEDFNAENGPSFGCSYPNVGDRDHAEIVEEFRPAAIVEIFSSLPANMPDYPDYYEI